LEYQRALVFRKTPPETVSALQRAFKEGGWKSYWNRSLVGELKDSKRGYVSPYTIAVLYARLGDKQNAIHYLDEAYAKRDASLTSIRFDPDLELLHGDPNYAALLSEMGLNDLSREATGGS
jgi:hypothetical protein